MKEATKNEPVQLYARFCPCCGTQHGVPKGEAAPWPKITRPQIEAMPDLLATLEQIAAILTQPVQFTKIRNGASCDVLRADCAAAVNAARAVLAKAQGKA